MNLFYYNVNRNENRYKYRNADRNMDHNAERIANRKAEKNIDNTDWEFYSDRFFLFQPFTYDNR